MRGHPRGWPCLGTTQGLAMPEISPHQPLQTPAGCGAVPRPGGRSVPSVVPSLAPHVPWQQGQPWTPEVSLLQPHPAHATPVLCVVTSGGCLAGGGTQLGRGARWVHLTPLSPHLRRPLAVPGGADAAGAVPGEALPPPPHRAAARRGAHGGQVSPGGSGGDHAGAQRRGGRGLSLSPCRDYVRRELEYGFQGAVYSDPAALGRFATALAGELGGSQPPKTSPVRGWEVALGRVRVSCADPAAGAITRGMVWWVTMARLSRVVRTVWHGAGEIDMSPGGFLLPPPPPGLTGEGAEWSQGAACGRGQQQGLPWGRAACKVCPPGQHLRPAPHLLQWVLVQSGCAGGARGSCILLHAQASPSPLQASSACVSSAPS